MLYIISFVGNAITNTIMKSLSRELTNSTHSRIPLKNSRYSRYSRYSCYSTYSRYSRYSCYSRTHATHAINLPNLLNPLHIYIQTHKHTHTHTHTHTHMSGGQRSHEHGGFSTNARTNTKLNPKLQA